jgi:hypothetical protein
MLGAARFLLRRRNGSTNWLEKMVASGAVGGILALLVCAAMRASQHSAYSGCFYDALALRRMVVGRVALPSQRRFVGSNYCKAVLAGSRGLRRTVL